MKKTLLLLLATIFVSSPALAVPGAFGYDLEADINRNNPKYSKNKAKSNTATKTKTKKTKNTEAQAPQFHGDNIEATWEDEVCHYPNATMKTAVAKYKTGNYSGALQELISITKKDPSNPVVYYYLGMAYTQVGNKDQAIKAYENVIRLNSDDTLTKYATKGRDCLVGGPTCQEETTDSSLEEFVNSPYGNGLSKEINQNIKQQELKRIKDTINKKQILDEKDIDRIQDFDDNTSEVKPSEKVATSDKDILSAIETLKNAGITVTVNPYQQPMMENNEYAQLQMLFGNNNNNNNSMMSMLPYLMSQNQSGKNIDPQIFQSMMMNSMIPDFTFNDKRD